MKHKIRVAVLTALLCTAAVFAVVKTSSFSAMQTVSSSDGIRLPIIMYHALLKDSSMQNEYVISPDIFEQDLQYIAANGYTTVTMAEVIDYVKNGTPLPDKPIMLTFDDGYYNNYVYAYPLLQKYNMKAVISPIVSMTEKYSNSGEINPYYTHMTWQMIAEAIQNGTIEIQNHSYALHKNTSTQKGAAQALGETENDYAKRLTKDLLQAQNLLTLYAGCTPSTFVYPFGAVSNTSDEVLKSLGFSASMTCEEKVNTVYPSDEDCLFHLGRFRRRNFMSSEEFFKKIK